MKYLIDASEAMAKSRAWPNVLLEPRTWWVMANYCDEIAFVIRKEEGPYLQFMEVLAQNIGAKLKLFSNAEGAYKWLGIN